MGLRVAVAARATVLALLVAPAYSAAAQEASHGVRDAAVAVEMASAAHALIEATQSPQPIAQTMGYNPDEKLHLPFAEMARDDWSYWPRGRAGLALGEMTAEQRMLAHELLETLLSARGYLEVQAIWSLEAV